MKFRLNVTLTIVAVAAATAAYALSPVKLDFLCRHSDAGGPPGVMCAVGVWVDRW